VVVGLLVCSCSSSVGGGGGDDGDDGDDGHDRGFAVSRRVVDVSRPGGDTVQRHHPAARGAGAETKDRVENAAHLAVCSGRLPLAAAQQGMEANWYALGRTLGVL
jgi:hypothetical protein